jgi:hypothetical protein
VPQNDGNLAVKQGVDPRFPDIGYAPNTFVAQPKATTAIIVTVTTPTDLAPGVYLVPGLVRPNPQATGPIRIQNDIVALVTFQIPGTTRSHVVPSFIGSATRTVSLPGLPAMQFGTAGHQVLRVLDDSPSSFYAYNEIISTQTPFGSAAFKGHTPGEPTDLRHASSLYFPGRYRDYPVTWSPSPIGIGTAHLVASVGYSSNGGGIAVASTSIEVLVVSPLWILVLVVYLGLLLVGARRRGRRQIAAAATEPRARSLSGRLGQIVGSLVMVAVIVAAVPLSNDVLFGAIGLVGVVVAAGGVVRGRHADRAAVARQLLWYQAAIGLLLAAGAVAVLLAVVASMASDVSLGVLAGAAVWVVVAYWALWWNEERPAPTARGPEGSGRPGSTRVAASVGS